MQNSPGPRLPSGCYVHSDPQQPTGPPARYFPLIKYQKNLRIAKDYVSEVVSKGIFCLAVFIWSNYTLSRESSIFLYSLKQKKIFFFIFLKKKSIRWTGGKCSLCNQWWWEDWQTLCRRALSFISPNMHIINSKCVKDIIIIYINLFFQLYFVKQNHVVCF